LWVGLITLYLVLGLALRSKLSIQIAMWALGLCSIRLLAFDLIQHELSVKAIVFIGVGLFMLAISAIYKKYKHRIEAHA
ncbi:MAG: hypothetical protein LLG04_12180, partial [Parachlamydia sp.]|nr:hypothetical protein [Parachlamydia sp.]